MGLLVTSDAVNALLRAAVAANFGAGNARNLRFDRDPIEHEL